MKIWSLMVVLILGLAACREKGPATDIAILSNSMSNPYWKTIYDGFEDTSKALGHDIYIQTLNKIGDAEEQANQCENALLRKPKAIIFAAVNQVNLVPCLQKASTAGIVLVDIDGNFNEQDAATHQLNVAFSVASNNYDLGKLAAEYVAAKKGAALIIEGASGSTPSQRRVAGFHEHLPDGMTIAATLSANWDMLQASNITQDILLKQPDLSVIFAANDQMALGAAEAVAQSGRTGITIIGVDGTGDAIQSLKVGRLTATVAQLPYLMAKQALEKTMTYLDHPGSLPFNQYVPILTIDKNVLDQNTDPLLAYVR